MIERIYLFESIYPPHLCRWAQLVVKMSDLNRIEKEREQFRELWVLRGRK